MEPFANSNSSYTNILTPPDVSYDDNHTVVLIDASAQQIDDLAQWCGSSQKSYNIYLYRSDMNNLPWLESACGGADAILVNTVVNELSPVKDRLITTYSNSWYYGPKNFLTNTQSITGPEKYFQYWDSVK